MLQTTTVETVCVEKRKSKEQKKTMSNKLC